MIDMLELLPGHDGAVWPYANVGRYFRPHTHAELELNVVLQGEAAYLVHGRRVQLRRGSMLWLPTDAEHVLVEESATFRMFIVVFHPRVAEDCTYQQLTKRLGLPVEDLLCRQVPAEEVSRLVFLLKDIAGSAGSAEVFNSGLTYFRQRAEQVFVAHADPPLSTSIHPSVAAAARMIEAGNHVDTLPELAQRVYLSKARLSHLFKLQLGIGIAEFRNQCRLERVIEACRRNRCKLLPAALAAGFGSYAQFHRVCVQLTGLSPRDLISSRNTAT